MIESVDFGSNLIVFSFVIFDQYKYQTKLTFDTFFSSCAIFYAPFLLFSLVYIFMAGGAKASFSPDQGFVDSKSIGDP